MASAAVILLADTETPAGTGRMPNALTTVQEFQETARAYGVKDAIDEAGIPLLDEHRGHASPRPHGARVSSRHVVTYGNRSNRLAGRVA